LTTDEPIEPDLMMKDKDKATKVTTTTSKLPTVNTSSKTTGSTTSELSSETMGPTATSELTTIVEQIEHTLAMEDKEEATKAMNNIFGQLGMEDKEEATKAMNNIFGQLGQDTFKLGSKWELIFDWVGSGGFGAKDHLSHMIQCLYGFKSQQGLKHADAIAYFHDYLHNSFGLQYSRITKSPAWESLMTRRTAMEDKLLEDENKEQYKLLEDENKEQVRCKNMTAKQKLEERYQREAVLLKTTLRRQIHRLMKDLGKETLPTLHEIYGDVNNTNRPVDFFKNDTALCYYGGYNRKGKALDQPKLKGRSDEHHTVQQERLELLSTQSHQPHTFTPIRQKETLILIDALFKRTGKCQCDVKDLKIIILKELPKRMGDKESMSSEESTIDEDAMSDEESTSDGTSTVSSGDHTTKPSPLGESAMGSTKVDAGEAGTSHNRSTQDDAKKKKEWFGVMYENLDEDLTHHELVTELGNEPVLMAASIGYLKMVQELNKAGVYLEEFLDSGKKMHKALDSAALGVSAEGGGSSSSQVQEKLVATCVPLISKRLHKKIARLRKKGKKCFVVAPIVVHIKNPYSSAFKNKFLDFIDRLAFCTDIQSGGGENSLRASVTCDEKGETIFLPPLIRLGSQNAIIADTADEIEQLWFQVQTDYSELFREKTEEVLINVMGMRANINNQGVALNNAPSSAAGVELGDADRTSTEGPSQADSSKDQASMPASGGKKAVLVETVTEGEAELDNDKIQKATVAVIRSSNSHKRKLPLRDDGATPNSKKCRQDTCASSVGGDEAVGKTSRNTSAQLKPAQTSVQHWKLKGMSQQPKRKSPGSQDESNKRARPDRFKFPWFGGAQLCVGRALAKFVCNMQIIKSGIFATYAKHQDGSGILNSPSAGTPRYSNRKNLLPTKFQMVVPTTVLGRDQFSLETKLRWYKDGRDDDVWGEVVTHNNDIHFQGIGCQYFLLKHSGAPNRGSQTKSRGKGKKSQVVAADLHTGEMEIPDCDGYESDADVPGTEVLDLDDDKSETELPEEAKIMLKTKVRATRTVLTARMCALPDIDKDSYRTGIQMDGLSAKQLARKDEHNVYDKYDRHNVVTKYKDLSPPIKKKKWWQDDNIAPALSTRTESNGEDAGKNAPCKPCKRCRDLWKFKKLSQQDMNKFHMSEISPVDADGNAGKIRGIRKPSKTIGVRQSRANVVRDRHVTEKALKMKRVVRLVKPVKKKAAAEQEGEEMTLAESQPLFLPDDCKQPIPPGVKQRRDAVPMGKRQAGNCIIHESNLSVAAVYQRYKNDPRGFREHIAFMKDFYTAVVNKKPTESELENLRKRYKQLGPLIMGGTGGSSQQAGVHTPGRNSSQDDVHFKTGAAQEFDSPENKAMGSCSSLQNAVALYICLDTWDHQPKSKRKKEEGFQLLGYYRVKSYTRKALTAEEVHARWSEEQDMMYLKGDNLDYLSFLLFEHDEFTLEPAFEFETVQAIAENHRDKKNEYEYLDVSVMAKSPIAAPVFELQEKHSEELSPILKFFFLCTGHGKERMSAEEQKEVDKQMEAWRPWPSEEDFKRGTDKTRAILTYCKDLNVTIPVPWIMPENILAHKNASLRGMDKQGASKEDGKDELAELARFEKWVKGHDASAKKYRFKPLELLDVAKVLMGAAALRSDSKVSARKQSKVNKATGETEETEEIEALPLATKKSVLLPDPARTKPCNCPNRDYDVATAAFRENARSYIRELINPQPRPEGVCEGEGVSSPLELPDSEDFPGVFRGLDLSKSDHASLVTELLFMAIVGRLTGRQNMMSLYKKWKQEFGGGKSKGNEDCGDGGKSKSGDVTRWLPTTSSVAEFCQFLKEHLPDEKDGTAPSIGPFVSTQHPKLVPKKLTEDRNNFCDFLGMMADKKCRQGMESVEAYLKSAGKSLTWRDLQVAIVRAVSDCGDLQMENNVYWIAQAVMADVDSLLPGFAGTPRAEDIIFGFGSCLGLDLLILGDKELDSAVEDQRSERIQAVFQILKEDMESRTELELKALGYKKDANGILQSLLTGRSFSLIDVEHFCCKLSQGILISHSSRTVSKQPNVQNDSRWPLFPGTEGWASLELESFKQIWEAFCHEEVEHPYPPLLQYQHDGWVKDPTAVFENEAEDDSNADEELTS